MKFQLIRTVKADNGIGQRFTESAELDGFDVILVYLIG
jgi:hypothetical protein